MERTYCGPSRSPTPKDVKSGRFPVIAGPGTRCAQNPCNVSAALLHCTRPAERRPSVSREYSRLVLGGLLKGPPARNGCLLTILAECRAPLRTIDLEWATHNVPDELCHVPVCQELNGNVSGYEAIDSTAVMINLP
jgi:hypothetical protein